jgi:chromosome segregation ATPase
LSSQLENIAPQLASLEKALSESRSKLKEEQKLRRQAEQAQDELEARYREADGSLLAVREECDAVHEELAFKESELEETRLDLEVEKERHRVELEDLRVDAALGQPSDKKDDETARTDQATSASNQALGSATGGASLPAVDDAYVKKLEDELELVTEQLIETEQRLSQTEEKLENSNLDTVLAGGDDKKMSEEEMKSIEKDKELIRVLQEESAFRLEDEHKLREELELTREELSLTQEELRAVEFDSKEVSGKMDSVRQVHREELNSLRSLLKNTENHSKASDAEVDTFESTLKRATEENAVLRDEVDNQNAAIANAKRDNQAVMEELEAVNERFDLAQREAEKRGREDAGFDLKEEMKSEWDAEIKDLKDQFKKLSEENAALQSRVDDSEMSLALAKDSRTRNQEGAEVQSEMVKQLTSQLGRARDDLGKKEKEMAVLVSSMEARVTKAEDNVTKLEKELSVSKGKLAEAEAHLIVSRREKELAEASSIPKRSSVSRSDDESSRTFRSASSSFHPDLQKMAPKHKVTRRRRVRSNSPNSYKRLEIRLSEGVKTLKELQSEHDKLKDQKRMGEVHIKRLEEDLKVLQRQLFSKGEAGVTTQMSRLSSLANGKGGMDLMDSDAKSKVDEIIESGDSGLMKEELRTLEKRCNAQRDYNNQLLSKMLSLQGNIQVFCRIRPMSIGEVQKGYKTVVESLSESELGCYDSRTNKWKSFGFDRVWGPDQSNSQIFQDVEPLALSVVDGFNACIFAYGQT